MAKLKEEMVATYGVEITGVERTKREMARVTAAITSLRQAEYMPGATVLDSRFGSAKNFGGKDDIFVAKVDILEGRIQGAVSDAMASAMAEGRRQQTAALRAAETAHGRKRKGKGPGRDKTGEMIHAIATNVETQKSAGKTSILGWHGWRKGGRKAYYGFQEQGTAGRASGQQKKSLKRAVKARRADTNPAVGRGIPAANSLGYAIIPVREYLRRKLQALR